ncbi:MAG: zinc metalloprotease HtpX [Desulfovibrio sp.]|nr:zinc metalloprotease HtpX [Desulfovibrio sp.]
MNSQIKTILLLGILSAFLLLLGNVLGGQTGTLIALVLALCMNLGSYWFSDSLVLSMYHARETTPDDAPFLHEIVGTLARRARIPMPRIYIVPEESPNAFATGRDPEHAAVAVTEGLLRMMSSEQLAGVLAHEIAHIANRDILIQTMAAVLGSAIVSIANFFQFAHLFGNREEGSNPIAALLLMLLAPIAASLIQMAISRSREYLADETGARLCRNPDYLAQALEELGRASGQIPLQTGNPSTEHMFIVKPAFAVSDSVNNLFSTHPPLTERIQRLRQMR